MTPAEHIKELEAQQWYQEMRATIAREEAKNGPFKPSGLSADELMERINTALARPATDL